MRVSHKGPWKSVEIRVSVVFEGAKLGASCSKVADSPVPSGDIIVVVQVGYAQREHDWRGLSAESFVTEKRI